MTNNEKVANQNRVFVVSLQFEEHWKLTYTQVCEQMQVKRNNEENEKTAAERGWSPLEQL